MLTSKLGFQEWYNIDRWEVKKPLVELIYKTNYGHQQPIAKMIRMINEFEDSLPLGRSKFKAEVKEKDEIEPLW